MLFISFNFNLEQAAKTYTRKKVIIIFFNTTNLRFFNVRFPEMKYKTNKKAFLENKGFNNIKEVYYYILGLFRNVFQWSPAMKPGYK